MRIIIEDIKEEHFIKIVECFQENEDFVSMLSDILHSVDIYSIDFNKRNKKNEHS